MPGEEEHDSHANGPLKPYFSGGGEDSAASYADPDATIGAAVGPFKVCGVLGEGGYGIVYLAEQERPIRRRVALKIVKPGMDSRQVIARFEAERQALAVLDHPNIAHIYDAGTTPAGRPYFAMEYIEGLPVTEYCDREKRDLKDRLRLFLQVCDAVQHAHQKGIIHRDLKPSNILVTTGEGKPFVKVIDFGIAKALSRPLTERTLHTENSQFIGTPDYMSPEQAEMDNGSVDTRSDVYSLGVVLYELLTGVLPFDPQELRAGGVEQVRRTIRQQEPRTPSTRLTSMGEATRTIAERRGADLQTLIRQLRKELEWIPLKAMRKDPDRRYQSPLDLASDVENFLRGLPLRAGPESAAYRLRKFANRHRLPVMATAAMIVLLLAGLFVTHHLYVVAENSRHAAETARIAETSQRLEAERERDRAMRAEHEAQGRLAGMYEQQGRRFMQSGDWSHALVFLGQARSLAPDRLGVRLLLYECLRKYGDPNLCVRPPVLAWDRPGGAMDQGFATSPDRRLSALLGADRRSIRILETGTGALRSCFERPGVERLAFLPGNRYLVAKVGDDPSGHVIEVLDIEGNTIGARSRNNVRPEVIRRLAENLSWDAAQMLRAYTRILVPPQGDWFAFLDAATEGDAVSTKIVMWNTEKRTWHVAEGEYARHVMVGIGRLSPRAYGDGNITRLVTVDKDGWLQRWLSPDCAFGDTFPWPMIFGNCDPTGTRFVFVQKGPLAVLGTRRDNSEIRTFPGVARLSFSQDGSRLITARPQFPAGPNVAEDACGDLWDPLDGRHVAPIGGAALTNWHFSPDSRRLITEHVDGSIRVMTPATGAVLFEISAEQNQAAADLTADSEWLLTRRRDGSQGAFLWDLANGQSYEVFDGDSSMEDLTAGWLCEEIDAVFASSHAAPDRLPRFGFDGLRILASSGLWPCKSGAETLNGVDKRIEGYVPLRLDQGVIRSASQAEMLETRLSFFQSAKGLDANETADCLFSLTNLLIASGELDKATVMFRPVFSLSLADRPALESRRRQLAERIAAGYRVRADRRWRQNQHRAAVTDYEFSLEFQRTSDSLNALAWLHVTSPQAGDVRKALSLAREGCEDTEWSDWRLLATYAAACAELGDFREAIRFQERALGVLPPEAATQWRDNLTARLAMFQSDTPYEPNLEWVVPTENLVGRWTFDKDEQETIFDSTPHGQQGTLVRNARVLYDRYGGVLELAGDTGFVRCRRNPVLDITDAITVTAWVKDERSGSREDRSLVGVWNTWRLFRTGRSRTMGFTYLGLGAKGNQPVTRVVGTRDIADGAWHHLAAVYDQNSICVYVDGELDGSGPASAAMGTGVGGVDFGDEEVLEPQGTGVCLIDDVRVYHFALHRGNIAALYRAADRDMANRLSTDDAEPSY